MRSSTLTQHFHRHHQHQHGMLSLHAVTDGFSIYRALAYSAIHECCGTLCAAGHPEGAEETAVHGALSAITLWVRWLCVNRLSGRNLTAESRVGQGGRTFLYTLRAAHRIIRGAFKDADAGAVLRTLHPCGARRRLGLTPVISSTDCEGMDAKMAFKLLHMPLPVYMEQHVVCDFATSVMGLSCVFEDQLTGTVCKFTPGGGATRHQLHIVKNVYGHFEGRAVMRGPKPLLSNRDTT